jgi:class 3 adenylate cyclase
MTFGGEEMGTAGDSFLVLFDSAERAIRCALALVTALATIGISIRAGIHSGEVILAEGQARGVAVHIAARIVAAAAPGEVLVSAVTSELAEGGQELVFETRGQHRLKGIEREHELFAVSAAPQAH